VKRVIPIVWSFTLLLLAQVEFSSPEPKYRWVQGDSPTKELLELVEAVEHDMTLTCIQRLDTTPLRLAIEAMEKVPIDSNKEDVERLAQKLFEEYAKLRNGGCSSPDRFFTEEEFYPVQGEKPRYPIANPIISNLERALEGYQRIAIMGGWPRIEVNDTAYLYPERAYPEIPAIKERLRIEGFYDGPIDENQTYDQELRQAVVEFQRRHGLKPDGIIGPATLKAMNMSPEEKIEKILINIERLRWFLQDDPYFVFVNIPGFFLEVYEGNRSTFHSKVIVGRKKRPTPMMRHEISYAVLNPYWRAPKTIIEEDILPLLQEGNFKELERKGIIAATDYRGRNQIPFEDVDWSLYTSAEELPFYFLQKPGPHNFLGYLKLIFPNRFDVYLHDTNHRTLFKYPYRALSSGCIRVERPIELYYLLKSKEKKLTYRDIFDIIWSKRTKRVPFKRKIPVYLAYLTAYADPDGKCYFFNDIYGYDRRMGKLVRNRVHQLVTEAQ